MDLLAAIFMLAWGIWSIIAALTRRRSQWMTFGMPEKYLGQYHDFIINFLFGILSIILGVYTLYIAFKPV